MSALAPLLPEPPYWRRIRPAFGFPAVFLLRPPPLTGNTAGILSKKPAKSDLKSSAYPRTASPGFRPARKIQMILDGLMRTPKPLSPSLSHLRGNEIYNPFRPVQIGSFTSHRAVPLIASTAISPVRFRGRQSHASMPTCPDSRLAARISGPRHDHFAIPNPLRRRHHI